MFVCWPNESWLLQFRADNVKPSYTLHAILTTLFIKNHKQANPTDAIQNPFLFHISFFFSPVLLIRSFCTVKVFVAKAMGLFFNLQIQNKNKNKTTRKQKRCKFDGEIVLKQGKNCRCDSVVTISNKNKKKRDTENDYLMSVL